MYRHLLCVYPYRVELGRRNGFYPPLGLEIIAAALSPHSSAIDVIDLRQEGGRSLDFVRPETDAVCFSVNWNREDSGVRAEIRSIPRHVFTIVGGRCATEDPNRWMEDCPNIDVLVRGDGEEAVREIAEGKPLGEIAGISHRVDGEVVHNAARASAPCRDDLYPDRLLRKYTYALDQGGLCGSPFDTVASSRGCPFNCSFCTFSRNPWSEKRSWSARSPESVVREIEGIKADIIFFVDDNFTHDADRVAAICDLLMARGIRKRFMANARVEIAKRPDVLDKMKRAGFSMLMLGIESAQDRTLKAMRKGFTIERLRTYFEVLRRTGMLLHGYFIVGNIGEDEADMLDIAALAYELGLDTVQLTLLRNERYGGLEELVDANPGYHIAPDGLIYSDEYSKQHLQQIRRKIHWRFHTRGGAFNLVKKGIRNKLVTPGMLLRLPWYLMLQGVAHLSRRRARKRLRRA